MFVCFVFGKSGKSPKGPSPQVQNLPIAIKLFNHKHQSSERNFQVCWDFAFSRLEMCNMHDTNTACMLAMWCLNYLAPILQALTPRVPDIVLTTFDHFLINSCHISQQPHLLLSAYIVLNSGDLCLSAPDIFTVHWFIVNYLVTGFLSVRHNCLHKRFQGLFNKQRNNMMRRAITISSPLQKQPCLLHIHASQFLYNMKCDLKLYQRNHDPVQDFH